MKQILLSSSNSGLSIGADSLYLPVLLLKAIKSFKMLNIS
jgi:hypothetical protein